MARDWEVATAPCSLMALDSAVDTDRRRLVVRLSEGLYAIVAHRFALVV